MQIIYNQTLRREIRGRNEVINMSKEVKALITIYKQIKSVNEYRFIGFTPWEIAIELKSSRAYH